MSQVIDAVMNQISEQHVDAIARQLGTDPATAQGAIEHALPLLVGAMAHHGSAGNADLLHGLASDHSNVDVGGMLGGLLGGGGNSGGGGLGDLLGGMLGNRGAGGGGILEQIFGDHHDHATTGLGQATGLDSGRAAQLMAMLAPIVLSALGRYAASRGMNASDMSNDLARQTRDAHAGGGSIGDLLSGVLGRLGGGANAGGGGGINVGGILGSLIRG